MKRQAAPIRLPRWIAGLWRDDEAMFDDTAAMKIALDAAIGRYNAIAAAIDRSLDRLEAERIWDCRPLFLAENGKPSHDEIRLWARGFWRAMTLVPDTRTAPLKGEHGQILMRPLIGFFEPTGEPPFAIDSPENLDEDAAAIPHAILLLRKLART